MKRFGGLWGCEGCEEVPTPVGVECLYCNEVIGPEDKGVVMPFLDEGGKWREVAEHRLCMLRQILPPNVLEWLLKEGKL